MSDREISAFQDVQIGLAEGERMILSDLLSHDAEVLSGILGYHVEDGILQNLRKEFEAEVEEEDPSIRIVLLGKINRHSSELHSIESLTELLAYRLKYAALTGEEIYDVELHDVQVFEV